MMETDDRRNPLEELHTFDPETANMVRAVLDMKDLRVSTEALTMLVDETIWGLCMEVTFGRAIAKGFLQLTHPDSLKHLKKYRELLRKVGETGPAIGRILATYLVPVLQSGDDGLLRRFLNAVDIMEKKGTYTLNRPLETLQLLLESDQRQAANVYIELLCETFSLPLGYNQSLHFAHSLPAAVRSFAPRKRDWQLKQLLRVMQTDCQLVDAFLEGVEKGLHLLSKCALQQFVSAGLRKYSRDVKAAVKFLSLNSRAGIDTLSELQIAASLSVLTPQLNRYLQARTGLAVSVRPLSALPRQDSVDKGVCSDGRFIYLPDEIDIFEQQSENEKLYKCLTRFESGHYEFGTFDFDLEKMLDRWPARAGGIQQVAAFVDAGGVSKDAEGMSSLDHFFKLFPLPELARDLFTTFEHGRVLHLLTRHYPGLVRTYLPMLQKEALRMLGGQLIADPLLILYARMALGIDTHLRQGRNNEMQDWLHTAGLSFEAMIDRAHDGPEEAAVLVGITYRDTEALVKRSQSIHRRGDSLYKPMQIPFQRCLRADLYYAAQQPLEQMAQTVRNRLAEKGLRAYKSDIKKYLITHRGCIDIDALKDVLHNCASNAADRRLDDRQVSVDLAEVDLSDLYQIFTIDLPCIDSGTHSACLYKEWDCHLGDYLNDHARVVDRIPCCQDNRYYHRTLRRYSGLIQKIRYSFELLRPEGLKLYRRWIEGDAFDYRALLDFVVDKKAGRTPSERLYIKRLKEIRDVAVLLLVDLSRSTANIASGNSSAVIEVEKEAIVLFSEALEVVGDAYAIAGFSGAGRLGVDYFHIKDFNEQMSDSVRQRIAAMTPQRNTRMGAAIRHAAAQFSNIASRVRLVIILGDGFPNDLEYKGDYAIEDTRVAISELRALNIYVHAITINMNLSAGSRLDGLYGDIHHNMIAEVSELPDKLWRIYGSLTR